MFASEFFHSSISRYVVADDCRRRATRQYPAAVPLNSDRSFCGTQCCRTRLSSSDGIARRSRSAIPPIAPLRDNQRQTFRIIHPFHPLAGQEFELVTYRHNWGEERVYFQSSGGEVCAVPASWTDLITQDPFIVIAAGRSLFRVEDLLRLAELIT